MSKINLRQECKDCSKCNLDCDYKFEPKMPNEPSGVYLESQEEVILTQYNEVMKIMMDLITNYTKENLKY